MEIRVYESNDQARWDDFVTESKNATFLFYRNYMEYHRDRFQDHSLIIRDDKDKIIALLPANQNQTTFTSHSGLTYGGIICNKSMTVSKMLQVFEDILGYLQHNQFEKFIYKTIPYIYHQMPAEEDRYALFLCGARLIRRGVLTVVYGNTIPSFQERRMRGTKKAIKNGLAVTQSQMWPAFWTILEERLRVTYQTKPVHTLDEIMHLASQFPNNIKLFVATLSDLIVGGVVIYESEFVAHVQYIAANDLGRSLSALDLIFYELLAKYYLTKPFFDFGTSDENNGYYLNKGLIEQKEGFGARAVAQDNYEIDLKDYMPGKLIGVMS